MQKSKVNIKITKPLLDMFASLTSDISSLHVDSKFARRSMYRENVAHGMLSVVFIALIPGLTEYKNINFKKISARFLKAVFIDDEIELVFSLIGDDKAQKVIEVEYSLKNSLSGAVLTTGYFLANYDCPAVSLDKSLIGSPQMICDKITESNYSFEEINKGLRANFTFVISDESLELFCRILKSGLGVSDFDVEKDQESFSNLLTLSLFSTFIGVCIPGQRATFVDFTVNFGEKIDLNKIYNLQGEVAFKSQSTRTLVEDLNIFEVGSDKNCAQGKVKTQVQEGDIIMASIEDLKKNCLDLNLKDKVVLITGASRGIGEVTAKLFALYGARIVVNYFKGEQDAKRIVEEICANGGQAIAVGADVSNRQQVKVMVQSACEKFGTVNILVNNAVRDNLPAPFMDLTWEDFQKDIDVNVKGAFNCCQEVVPLMMKNKEGKIINIVTVATDNPPAKQAKYVVSKSALVGLSRSLAVDLAAHNIQVNMVSPNLVETDLTKHVPKMFFEKVKSETPMQRNTSADDVAKAVIFLASSLSSFTTGQKIMVTGGNAPFL